MPAAFPPHPTWKPELPEDERVRTWATAAGDGKRPSQHIEARRCFSRKANEDAVEVKNGVGLDENDIAVLENKRIRLSKKTAAERARLQKPGKLDRKKENQSAWREKPGNREKIMKKALARRENPEIHAKILEKALAWREKPEIHAKILEKGRVWRENPENRAKNIETSRAWRAKPGNRDKNIESSRAWREKHGSSALFNARADALQAERAVESKANGAGLTTEYSWVCGVLGV
jgi:hypothetical protein